MASLTIEILEDVAKQELGSLPDGAHSVRDYANMAGRHLMGARQWQWAEGREARLRPRVALDIEAATWTEATLRLTLVDAFEDYEFLSGDTIQITDGTGATTGTYEVASRVDDDSITLVESIGADADGETDIEGVMPNDQIALPSDFGLQQITAWAASDGFIGDLQPTTTQQMATLRSQGLRGSSIGFWTLLRHVRSTAGGRPVPRLELFPRSADDAESLIIHYRGGWLEPSTDTEVLSIPDWLDQLYLEMFKATLMGHEEPEQGSVSARLTAIRQGIVWADALAFDAGMQTDFGGRVNTWLDDGALPTSRYDYPVREILPP